MRQIVSLSSIWERQKSYNEQVKSRQQRTPAEWMETYVLGLLSEAGQLLDSMRWKRHKLESIEDFTPNVPTELADLTKYVLSMWQLMGFTPEKMLQEVDLKSRFLEQKYQQDFNHIMQGKVVIFDLDDVLADHRSAVLEIMQKSLGKVSSEEPTSSIHLDEENGWEFDKYRQIKNEFEATGGYRTLSPLFEIPQLFHLLRDRECSIVVWTARPVRVFKSIALDTFMWFEELGCQPDVLNFGREERILHATKLKSDNKKVVLVEDNFDLALRAYNAGIPIVVPQKTYNKGIANFVGDTLDLLGAIEKGLDKCK